MLPDNVCTATETAKYPFSVGEIALTNVFIFANIGVAQGVSLDLESKLVAHGTPQQLNTIIVGL